MTRQTMERIMEIQEMAWQDPATCQLAEEHARINQYFLQTVKTMTKEQQDTVFQYIGSLIELQNQFLVYAVETKEAV